LGFDKYCSFDETGFLEAGSGNLWIGSIDCCIALYTPIALDFFQDKPENEAFEILKGGLLKRFPEGKIAALALHSVIGMWGFAVLEHGHLIRRSYGYDGNVVHDEGPRLQCEEDYLSRYQAIETDESLTCKDPDHPEYDAMKYADLGEDLVFEICRSMTGHSLDSPAFCDIRGTNFWLGDDGPPLVLSGQGTLKSQTQPWWKFWR